MIGRWSEWRKFPNPGKGDLLVAPFGPGCYDLRNGSQLVTYGKGGHCAQRMTSLLPGPHGAGTRNNASKREYIFSNLPAIEYRTIAFKSEADAKAHEQHIKETRGHLYLFPR